MKRLTLDNVSYENPDVADVCPCCWGEVVEVKNNKKIVYCIFGDNCIKKEENKGDKNYD